MPDDKAKDPRVQLSLELEQLFEELIAHQRGRVRERAQRLAPRITDDDLLSPVDVPELAADPEWNYEDGLLAGYLAAQMAVRAHILRG